MSDERSTRPGPGRLSGDQPTLDDELTGAAPPRPRPAGAPERVGHYRVLGELGRGGMGVVYRALDERLDRDVALKALPAELADDPDRLERLEGEARALASVSHPNVGIIHGMERDGRSVHLVLELIEGRTLDDRLREGPMPLEEAVETCRQVAAGLHAVHRKGLVHRDLKASNVMITSEGQAKLLDFGLARRAVTSPLERTRSENTIVGTPGWMSPEQLRGEDVDARSDAWAWGCLLFQCLAAAPAFPGDGWEERDAATLDGEPDWDRLPEDLPEELRALLEACLEKDRERRPASLEEAASRLSSAESSAARRAIVPPHALPPERDEFVGREEHLAALAEQLEAGSRLVSVIGIGGSGKTRLVQHLAREQLESWPGGVWFCDLSEARSADGILHAVAAGLDVPLQGGDPVDRLGQALAGRGRCLVILDNFEQVARHAESTLGRWLDLAGEARFVVTTREVLGLAGESSLDLPPLESAEATALFVVRARQRGFETRPEDEEAVARLVELLDRLPLAVELAAARARLLRPRQLLERMSDRFRLLRSGGGRHERQATLQATLDWSWDLLDECERAALAQCSVFEGGFTLEAAEGVLDLSAWPDAPWPMDAVQALVEKSLVQAAGDGRFDLLVSVQQYAADRLASQGDEAVSAAERRHGEHYADLIRSFGEHSAEQGRRGSPVAVELDNLVAATRRAVRRGDAACAVVNFGGAHDLMRRRGPAGLANELGAEVLAMDGLDSSDRARVLDVLALTLRVEGRGEEALACSDEAAALQRAAGDAGAEAKAITGRAMTLERLGRLDEALAAAEQAQRLAEESGHELITFQAARVLGHLQHVAGRLDAAREGLTEALTRWEGRVAAELTASVHFMLGLVELKSGRLDEARRAYERALKAYRESGDEMDEAAVLGNLATLAVSQGRYEDARAFQERSMELQRRLGNAEGLGIVLGNSGDVAIRQGRFEEARPLLEEALEIHRSIGFRYGQGYWLAGLSRLALREGRFDEAVSLGREAVEVASAYAQEQAGFACTLVAAQLAAGDVDGAAESLRSFASGPLAGELALRVASAHARVLLAQGELGGARSRLEEAEALLAELGLGPESDAAHEVAQVRSELGPRDESAPG